MLVVGLVFVAGAAVAAAASTLRTAPVPIGDPGSWHVVFDDEFNGSSLDTKKWSKGWFGTGVTQPLQPTSPACFDPRRVKVRNGSLNLSVSIKPETCGGKTRPYSAGIVTTDGKFSYTYGFAEIRAKLAVSPTGVVYDWPDFWSDGQNWPTDGEDDVVEGLGGQLCWHFHSSAGSPGTCLSTPLKPGWHTFGADWEPAGVTYYYDGTVVGTITAGITSAPMYLIISFVADPEYSGPIRAASFRVAYVRVWQH
jgi:beta-glucanase (GH16 family)